MSVSSRESYRQQGEVHIQGDKRVGWKEVLDAQNTIAGHTKALGNIYRMGENWGGKGETRVRGAMNEQSTIIPQMDIYPKDHKDLRPDGTP